MRRVDQGPEVVRRAVGGMRREGQHAVIAPAAATGELRDGHQLGSGKAGLGQCDQAVDRRPEGPGLGKGPDVDLTDHRLLPRPSTPAGVVPDEGGRVDKARRTI